MLDILFNHVKPSTFAAKPIILGENCPPKSLTSLANFKASAAWRWSFQVLLCRAKNKDMTDLYFQIYVQICPNRCPNMDRYMVWPKISLSFCSKQQSGPCCLWKSLEQILGNTKNIGYRGNWCRFPKNRPLEKQLISRKKPARRSPATVGIHGSISWPHPARAAAPKSFHLTITVRTLW